MVTVAEEGEWKNCIHGSDAVVNLAGMPISTRWSPEIKKEIKQSRTRVTSKVVDLINNTNADLRPSVLVSATAIGYYGTSETQVFDETSPPGNDYLAEVCKEWEGKALEVDKDVRLALIRIGIVLGKDGGALAKMIPLFMMFAGGPIGNGQQWFSWIHLDDLVNLIYEAIINPSYKGIINGTAPNPVRFSEMCEQLGQVMGRPSWLPVPDFALKAVLGEGATVVLNGQKVLPVKAMELGFSYKYPYIRDALKAIISSGSYSLRALDLPMKRKIPAAEVLFDAKKRLLSASGETYSSLATRSAMVVQDEVASNLDVLHSSGSAETDLEILRTYARRRRWSDVDQMSTDIKIA